ncbi:MAG: hypothetical protein ACT4PU_04595 [Planctomycetota bacterium]
MSTLLMLSGAARAQDNDSEGVLPYAGGGDCSSAATVGLSVGVSAELIQPMLDARLARVELQSHVGAVQVNLEAPAEEATFAGLSAVVAVESWDALVGVQGFGLLMLQEGFGAVLRPAHDATLSVAVLVLDDGQDPLEDVLAGRTQPDLIVNFGWLPALDLVSFQALLSKYAAQLPGVHATVVMMSLDSQGALHTAAARASVDGEPLEIWIQ